SRSVTVSVQTSPTPTPTDTSLFTLVYDPADRVGAVALNGMTVRGTGLVWLWPETAVQSVAFYVDGRLYRNESKAYFDLGGSSAYNFGALATGSHSVRAVATLSNGTQA